MKVIKVENQVQGGKVAFEILKEKLANGAQTLGLRQEVAHLNFTRKLLRVTLIFQI
ncbi:6-phosphogluconolactonase/Glucosamine-6-phosphateisomerase/deaminase [Streptococcus pneumoniae]|nr:6-phosphogluconolactonase/Glucosamine-6-phosphateisomerase/deaminase [Streptococcus pneumoniae]